MATLIKFVNKWTHSNKGGGLSRIDSAVSNVGNVVMFAGPAEKIPNGWLLCDGTEYAIADYPKLYALIGNMYGGTEGSTFKVPDYRECALVGAGQNGTDTISSHDVYDVGQFKDDQLQRITGYRGHSVRVYSPYGAFYGSGTGRNDDGSPFGGRRGNTFDSAYQVRSGTTTHGKQKGVNYIIHA